MKTVLIKIRLAAVLLFLFFILSSKAQNWQPLGPDDNNQPTFAGATNINVKANHAGVVHMAYRDANDYLRVRKYNGTQWVDVGGNISIAAPGIPSLTFDTADIPYVAFPDFGFFQGCVSVKRFVLGTWQQVGTSCFSTTFPDNVHIAISSLDSVFVLWRDGNTNKSNLKKFDGNANWNLVGVADFSGSTINSCDLGLDSMDSIYVACANAASTKVSVKKFSNNNWSLVGSADFSIGTTSSVKMLVDAANNPSVGYMNTASGNKPIAMKWDGTNWNAIGTTLAGNGTFDGNGFVFLLANGMPTFAYADFFAGSSTVQQYNGSSWNYLGNHYLTPMNASISYLGATSDNAGNVVVMYRDGYNQQKVTAKKYVGGVWTDFETRGLAIGYMTDVRTFIDYNGIPYICYSDVINNYKACVKKFVGGNWVDVGLPGFSDDRADNFSMVFDKNSIPYVCYHDWAVNGSTIQKFNGTTWVTVGVKGITGRTAFTPYMSMDTVTTTPYVISQDDNGHGYRSIVEKFDGTNWVLVGSTPNFSVGRVFNPKIVITSTGVPYVTYADENINSQAVVKKFDGTNWVNVGAGIISAFFNTDYNSISLGKNDTIYVAYKDAQVTLKAVVQKFDGTNWNLVSTNVGIGSIKYLSLANNANGAPYLGYEDGGDANKAYVKKYDLSSNTWKDLSSTPGPITSGSSDWVSIAVNKSNNATYFAYAFGDVYAKTIGNAITSSAGPNGAISPLGVNNISVGANASYTITPNPGYCILDVLVDGVSVGAVTSYAFNNVIISHTISVTFTPQVTPAVSIIVAPGNNICAGTNLTFTATATNGGPAPIYNFLVNGISVQSSNSNTFSSSALNDKDTIKCVLTANNTCQTSPTANSNPIGITTGANVTPSVSIATASNSICAGTNAVFTATPVNGGNAPSYNFFLNGNSVQNSSSNIYSNAALASGSVIKCIMTSNNACQTSPVANSNNIAMIINPLPAKPGAITGNLLNCAWNSSNNLSSTTWNGVWTSSSPIVASLSPGNSGSNSTLAKAISNGTTTITYTITTPETGCSNSVSAVYTVAAVNVPISSGAFFGVCIGSQAQLTNAAPGGVWSAQNNRASVDANGTITALIVGFASIKYTVTNALGCSNYDVRNVVINALPSVPTVSASPAIASLFGICKGKNIQLTGNPINGVWSSSNSNVATVSATGLVKTINQGNVTISYTITNLNGCSNKKSLIGSVGSCVGRDAIETNNDTEMKNDITIYPTITKPNSTIQIKMTTFNAIHGATLTISDVYGHQLMTKKVNSLEDLRIHIGNYAAGIYLVSFNNGNERIVQRLIIE